MKSSDHFRFPSGIALAVLLATMCCLSPRLQAQAGHSVLGAEGTTWGGQHVELEVTPEGASLQFDCATGAISKSLQVDAQSNFKVTGTFARGHGGPVMRNENSTMAATYSGSIKNGTMKLTITGVQGESFGDYVLERGTPGRVMKCR